MKNKLIFNGKQYSLQEIDYHKFRVFEQEKGEYDDVGWELQDSSIPYRECFSLRIKDKFYGLILDKQ